MKIKNAVKATGAACLAALALTLASGVALAQPHGGGEHAMSGGHFGGAAGGHAFAAPRGGFGGARGVPGGYGGYRGGYRGYGPYYGGYRGYGPYYGGWGWGGLGLGLYFASLPLYYSTYWWDGIPYYYADDTYYVYDRDVGQYETVAPPSGLQGGADSASSAGADLIAYPTNGQSADQQAKDKYECHHWATTQSGFDPTLGAGAPADKRSDYLRAQAACMTGRGYSVK